MSADPLLQPYQLKHLTLRNRIMMTSHEPAYAEGGMPKERYRASDEAVPWLKGLADAVHEHGAAIMMMKC